jgi:hypothetical protein
MLKPRAEYRGVQLNTTCQMLPGAGLSRYRKRTEHYLPGALGGAACGQVCVGA